MPRRVLLICDFCGIEYDESILTHGVDWINAGFNPSFNQYLKNPVTEICGNCAKKIANYMDGLRN